MRVILEYLIFPGFLFSLVIGGWGWWLERKLTARFQYRVGPPWYQTYLDILKLFLKETLVPENANSVIFVLSPILGLSVTILVALIINQICFLTTGFLGDIFVILYLLVIPSLFIVLGGSSSSNPLATVGVTREIKLMLAYEFIFIVSIIIAIIKSGGVLSLEGIITSQSRNSHLWSSSGAIGFLLGLVYIQAKLGIVPFDVSEAEQEIMSGPLIEYSGPLLGFYRTSKAILYFILPLLVVALYWGKGLKFSFVYKYLIILLLIAVVKNTNPRLRIRDILKFFWFGLFPLGCIGIIFALKGW